MLDDVKLSQDGYLNGGLLHKMINDSECVCFLVSDFVFGGVSSMLDSLGGCGQYLPVYFCVSCSRRGIRVS